MAVLDVFRSTVGAAAIGFARRALDESVTHVKTRQLFGKPLADLQLTQAAIATMATDVDAGALLVYRAAWAKDSGRARVDPRGSDGEVVCDGGGGPRLRPGGTAF